MPIVLSEPLPREIVDWLKVNNAPRCRDCGGRVMATGFIYYNNEARFECIEPQNDKEGWERSCRPTWVNIRPLTMREREED